MAFAYHDLLPLFHKSIAWNNVKHWWKLIKRGVHTWTLTVQQCWQCFVKFRPNFWYTLENCLVIFLKTSWSMPCVNVNYRNNRHNRLKIRFNSTNCNPRHTDAFFCKHSAIFWSNYIQFLRYFAKQHKPNMNLASMKGKMGQIRPAIEFYYLTKS